MANTDSAQLLSFRTCSIFFFRSPKQPNLPKPKRSLLSHCVLILLICDAKCQRLASTKRFSRTLTISYVVSHPLANIPSMNIVKQHSTPSSSLSSFFSQYSYRSFFVRRYVVVRLLIFSHFAIVQE